jgi:hypothetical protein
MNYSDQAVSDAKSKEALFRNFFGNVKALMTERAGDRPAWLSKPIGWMLPNEDRALMRLLLDTEDKVHQALCNNFDTPGHKTASPFFLPCPTRLLRCAP